MSPRTAESWCACLDAIDRYLLHVAGFPIVKRPPELRPNQWRQLADRAYADRLLVQLWKAAQIDRQIPPDVCGVLQADLAGELAIGMLLQHNLHRILEALERDEIPSCVLKGIALSQRLYGDPLARQSNDIDLLVHPRDRARAERALAELGFYPDGHGFTEGIDHHLGLFRDVGQTKVHLELHLGVNLGHQRIFPADWWNARVPIRAGADTLHIFRDDHLLVFLCAHASVHSYASLGWLVDIAVLLPQVQCSSAEILAAARAAGQTRAVFHTLSLLKSLGTPVDPVLLATLKPTFDRTWLIKLLLFRGPRTNTQFCRLISILAMATPDRRWFLPSFREFRHGYPKLPTVMAVLLYVPWLLRGIGRALTGLIKAGLALKH